jgi:hypothetical protein
LRVVDQRRGNNAALSTALIIATIALWLHSGFR